MNVIYVASTMCIFFCHISILFAFGASTRLSSIKAVQKSEMNLSLHIFTFKLKAAIKLFKQNNKYSAVICWNILQSVDNLLNIIQTCFHVITVDWESVVFVLVLAQCAVKTCFPLEILPRCPKTSDEHHILLPYLTYSIWLLCVTW